MEMRAMKPYDHILHPRSYTLANGKVVVEKRSRVPLVIIILVLATVVSGKITGFSFGM